MEEETATPQWLTWARQIQAQGQSGLAYNDNVYDRQRYQQMLTIAAEIVAAHTPLEPETLLNGFAQQVGYATPKVGVRGAVVRGATSGGAPDEAQVLLVKERADARWCLPGGWADVGETPSQMVEREVREESGLTVRAHKLVAVYDANRTPDKPLEFYHAYKMVFLCEKLDGAVRPGVETLNAAFFPFDHLPPLSHDRTNERILQEVRAHVADPSRPAAFD